MKFELPLPSQDEGVTLQVAPLIDLVFLLICFYLLVGQLVVHQNDPAVEPPRMTNPETTRQQPAELVINLRENGTIILAGWSVTKQEMAGILSQQLADSTRMNTELRVVVRADRRQTFSRLDEILNTCREIGLSKVVFRAKGEEEP